MDIGRRLALCDAYPKATMIPASDARMLTRRRPVREQGPVPPGVRDRQR